jgi:hypothetical protein
MLTLREPVLHPAALAELRPTQITVGMREVNAKRDGWREQEEKKKAEFLARHLIPVIRGPKARYYVIDHHHLSLALLNEGVETVRVIVVADLVDLKNEEFWVHLDNRGWLHPYDAMGRRRDFDDIPRRIADLKDDPFRSLAGELRRRGGFAKDTTPFSEFLWADFLRRRIDRAAAKHHFAEAMVEAMKLAKSPQTRHLPGWCGSHADHPASLGERRA